MFDISHWFFWDLTGLQHGFSFFKALSAVEAGDSSDLLYLQQLGSGTMYLTIILSKNPKNTRIFILFY